MQLIGVDLSAYIIESDKGSALTAICAKYNCQHIGCLRHFLAGLGKKPYSSQIGELVSAKCELDFEFLRGFYSVSFERYIESHELNDLQKLLGKAGLTYDVESKQIKIVSEHLWSSISQIRRISTLMPSTTNALESSHGHLNKNIPRRNYFWTCRISNYKGK